MATAAAIGLLCYYLGEAKQRRAFLEAKKSLEVKMVIEEQSAEQVNIQKIIQRLFRPVSETIQQNKTLHKTLIKSINKIADVSLD